MSILEQGRRWRALNVVAEVGTAIEGTARGARDARFDFEVHIRQMGDRSMATWAS